MVRVRKFSGMIAASAALGLIGVSAPSSNLASIASGPEALKLRRGATANLGQPVHVNPKFQVRTAGTTIPAPAPAPGTEEDNDPAFDVFTPPSGMAVDAGEPSIGINWNTGNIMFQAYVETDRVTIDDTVTPPQADWTDVTAPNAVISLDPILFTDPLSGRTAVSQLLSSLVVPGAGCSLAAVTADDGATWTPSTGCGVPGNYDHQTIGGGAYADPAVHPQALEDRGMYYCGQNGWLANCALSTDGGVTYGPAVPTYTDAGFPQIDSQKPDSTCLGLHGHIKVGPDGTAYLPNFACGTQGEANRLQGVVVSEDDGLTWTARTVPGALYNGFKSDPTVAIATDNTLYFAYEAKQGGVFATVSDNKGVDYSTPIELGTDLGVKNAVFPAAVAGDSDRAAVAFIGTTTKGAAPNFYEESTFPGEWHLYVSTTYDHGQTWKTVDVTPNDPVQRGCVWWGNPGGCPSAQRNLLDFMDATLDQYGRVVVGYADGCIGVCVTGGPNTREDIGAIARQARGLSMFGQYDAMFTPAI